ncbi:MAG: AAA-like domain-containing protein [Lyngbya sp.]|nr:AAA-like domain-containing protein [Lyngbya sp.]
MNCYQYQVGGSLSVDAPSYIERQADRQLYEALKQGEFCYILNCRQMGKSSLLVRTKHRLQQEQCICTAIDMTRIGSENITPSQWYKGVVGELWRGFNLMGKVSLKSWWKEEKEVSLIQRLSSFIEDVLLVHFPQEKIIIFIDEIDSILSLDFAVDDFFALIRFCYNQRAINPEFKRLAFAIFGVATPSDLIQDKIRTPFNIGTAIELQGFQLKEAESLAEGFHLEKDQSIAVFKQILNWTGGQPFLTQKICNLLTLSSKTNEDFISKLLFDPAFQVENLVRSHLIYQWESQDDPEHLRTIRARLLAHPELTARLLGIYQQILQGVAVEADDSREQTELILSGLVVKKCGYLQVKNRIYQEVFNLNWIEKKLNSLRPYSQAFEAWIASEKQDKSRLLRGTALAEAQRWASGKSLSDLDYQYLATSQECDRQEVEIQLKAERAKEVEARLIQEQKASELQRRLLIVICFAFIKTLAFGLTAFYKCNQAPQNEQNIRKSEIQALAFSSLDIACNQRLNPLTEEGVTESGVRSHRVRSQESGGKIAWGFAPPNNFDHRG